MPDPIITPLIDNTNSNDPVVALVQHRDVTMSDIQAYRKEHACSLGEACRALGWRGNRMYRPEGAIHHVLTHQQATYPATRLYALPREEKVQ